MLEEKDFIMRMIKQFTIAIARIMGLKAENKIEESQEVLTEILKDFTGLNKEVLEALPYEILIQKISGGREPNIEKCLMLCELLEQQADIYELKGETSGARNLYLKSLNIIMNVIIFDSDNQGDSDDPVLKPNQDKVDELVKKMGLPGVPTESKLLLFQYYELTKKYAKAEDVLYNLMDTAGKNSDILARGMDFYERLSGKDPAELEAGNLPMDEVLEGLAKLRLLNEETRLN